MEGMFVVRSVKNTIPTLTRTETPKEQSATDSLLNAVTLLKLYTMTTQGAVGVDLHPSRQRTRAAPR